MITNFCKFAYYTALCVALVASLANAEEHLSSPDHQLRGIARHLCYSMDGSLLLVARDSRSEVYRTDTWESVSTILNPYCTDFLPHMRQLVACNGLRVVDMFTGENIHTLDSLLQSYSIQTFPHKQVLLGIGGQNSTLKMYSTTDFLDLGTFCTLPHKPVKAEISQDGTKVIVGKKLPRKESVYHEEENTIHVYDFDSKEKIRSLRNENQTLFGFRTLPNSNEVASIWSDHTVRIHTISNGNNYRTFYINDTPTDIDISPDGCFMAVATAGGKAKIYNYRTGMHIRSLQIPYNFEARVLFSPRQKKQLLTSTPHAIQIWDYSDLYELHTFPYSETPTDIPIPPTPSATYTPTPTSTPTPTATFTPTATATPFIYQHINDDYQSRVLVIGESVGHLCIGQSVAEEEILTFAATDSATNQAWIFQINPPENTIFVNWNSILEPWRTIILLNRYDRYRDVITNFSINANDQIIAIANNKHVQITWDNGITRLLTLPEIIPRNCIVINESSTIPNTHPGDVLLGRHILRNPIPDEELTLEPFVDLDPVYLTGITIGPEGRLFYAYMGKILVMADNGSLQEWFPRQLDCGELLYHPVEQAFYFTAGRNKTNSDWYTISCLDQTVKPVGDFHQLVPHRHKTGFYANYASYFSVILDVHHTIDIPTPAPTPVEPTPTPTPIPGWFVLDGFGGIHASHPDLQRPVLPYWYGFNIIRDIEPDPLGRGWYMLDGFGGIHTSSPDLPRPVSLPYFGFDVARNLEIKEIDGQLEFFLLDGYGVIHSTVAEYKQENLPWFGKNIFVDLEPDPDSNKWTTLDTYGNIYFETNGSVDQITYAPAWARAPIMRGFVRFADHTTVMIDYSAGRHTNPYHPAPNRMEGFPSDFYFPGWPIIWDVEAVAK